jgi:predicted enzyme related to lactoylglutathione lyase
MLTGLAHTAVCVSDVEAAVAWYESAVGLTTLSPPWLMTGREIERDMGELVPSPVAVRAAILGLPGGDDRVLEVIEYPNAPEPAPRADAAITEPGFTHVGLTCVDIEATRRAMEARGVTFLTTGIADVAGLRTTWFRDPWGNVFILMEKHDPARAYYRQL